jgi:predicted DsbA family dithiol-disulfide isomerase
LADRHAHAQHDSEVLRAWIDLRINRIMISIDIWSDLLCPFCYIGKRHLALALARVSAANADGSAARAAAVRGSRVDQRWRSFQLDPGADRASPLTNDERLARKYGRSLAWARQLHDEIARRGAAVGLRFDFAAVKPTNSFDAHRLTHLAASRGRGDDVQERLFQAHFSDGQRIGDPVVLQRIGEAAGLDASEVRRLLEGDEFAAAVRGDAEEARRMGVTGVPFFLLNGTLAVHGAQPVETFVEAIQRAEGAAP